MTKSSEDKAPTSENSSVRSEESSSTINTPSNKLVSELEIPIGVQQFHIGTDINISNVASLSPNASSSPHISSDSEGADTLPKDTRISTASGKDILRGHRPHDKKAVIPPLSDTVDSSVHNGPMVSEKVQEFSEVLPSDENLTPEALVSSTFSYPEAGVGSNFQGSTNIPINNNILNLRRRYSASQLNQGRLPAKKIPPPGCSTSRIPVPVFRGKQHGIDVDNDIGPKKSDVVTTKLQVLGGLELFTKQEMQMLLTGLANVEEIDSYLFLFFAFFKLFSSLL